MCMLAYVHIMGDGGEGGQKTSPLEWIISFHVWKIIFGIIIIWFPLSFSTSLIFFKSISWPLFKIIVVCGSKGLVNKYNVLGLHNMCMFIFSADHLVLDNQPASSSLNMTSLALSTHYLPVTVYVWLRVPGHCPVHSSMPVGVVNPCMVKWVWDSIEEKFQHIVWKFLGQFLTKI